MTRHLNAGLPCHYLARILILLHTHCVRHPNCECCHCQLYPVRIFSLLRIPTRAQYHHQYSLKEVLEKTLRPQSASSLRAATRGHLERRLAKPLEILSGFLENPSLRNADNCIAPNSCTEHQSLKGLHLYIPDILKCLASSCLIGLTQGIQSKRALTGYLRSITLKT